MKKIFSIIFLLFTLTLYAEPIKEQRARELAVSFFNGGPMTRSVSAEVDLVWSGNALAETPALKAMSDTPELPSLYIFNRTDSDGFVIIAGDDRVRPVLAYSKEDAFDMNNIADGARFLISAWGEVIQSIRSGSGNRFTADATIEDLTNVKEELIYETALWGQGEPYNREAPEMEGQRCVTGCLATAMAIIAYYHEYPLKGTGTTPEFQCVYNDVTYTIPANELGREYDYDNMLFDYRNEYTDEQAAAVSALMKDTGTALKMRYSPYESYSFYIDALIAFSKYFGYSKDARMEMAESYTYDKWVAILKENLNEFGPTFYSGQTTSGGHAFVVDGYDNMNYFHFNFGWNGSSNGYYYLPDNLGFSYYQRALTNLYPDENGTSQYTDNIAAYYYSNKYPGIVSTAGKHESNKTFNVYLGDFINLSVVDFTNGKFLLRLYDKNGNLKEDLNEIDYTYTLAPDRLGWIGDLIPVTITSEIAPGDRIKVFYKGDNSTDWQLLRPFDSNALSEILLIASDVAEIQSKLNMEYHKNERLLRFYTYELALTISVEDLDQQKIMEPIDVPCMYYGDVDMSQIPGGTYNIIFESGPVKHTLQVTMPDLPADSATSSTGGLSSQIIDDGKIHDPSELPLRMR